LDASDTNAECPRRRYCDARRDLLTFADEEL